MKRQLLLICLLISCAVFVWQWMAIRRLSAEREQIRAEPTNAEAAIAIDGHATKSEAPSAGRLQAGQDELHRLRAEASRLRKDIEAAKIASAKNSPGLPTTNQSSSLPVVQTYVAEVHVNVPFSQTLVTGGWKLPSGKHAFVFIEPQPGDAPDQVSLQTKIVELPQELLATVGLESLKSDSTQTAGQLVLDDARARYVIRALEQQEGVDILGAPNALTLSGRRAQIKIANSILTPEGGHVEVGPLVDIVPTVSADGASANLRVSAHMRVVPQR